MGMFDSIYIKIKCPNCREISLMEFQTKDLDCILNNYHVGDFIGKSDQFNYLNCTASCHSEKCAKQDEVEQMREHGKVWRHGFGKIFDAKVYIKNGRITNKVEWVKEE